MPPPTPYHQIYINLQFERTGLFKLIRKILPIKSAFYPGCSFHITPSFFFETVYYVDKSDAVANFFADEKTIKKIIEPRQEVANPVWKFFHLDVEDSLSVIPEVDLVIALNGGDVLMHAFSKAKVKGYVLTSSNFSGEHFLKSDDRYSHLLNIGFQSGEYRIAKGGRDQKVNKSSFTKGNVFRDTGVYGVYQFL